MISRPVLWQCDELVLDLRKVTFVVRRLTEEYTVPDDWEVDEHFWEVVFDGEVGHDDEIWVRNSDGLDLIDAWKACNGY